jgi:hypothetical protein
LARQFVNAGFQRVEARAASTRNEIIPEFYKSVLLFRARSAQLIHNLGAGQRTIIERR